MGYLIFQILFFLLVAAGLGFVVGWLLRSSRLQTELRDLDARWRAKLSEVESERDQFAGEVNQANEARAKLEASAAEAKRLAAAGEANLQKLQGEHQSKLDAFADLEKRVGGLSGDLSSKERELADVKAALARQEAAGGDAQRAVKELAAATSRAETLGRDLKQAREANDACKREVERLEARVADLQAGGGQGGGTLGLVGSPPGDSAGSDTAGGTGGTIAGVGALGLVGGTDTVQGVDRSSETVGGESTGRVGTGGSGGRPGPGHQEKRASSPSHLAEAGGQSFSGPSGSASGAGDQDGEGVRPEALTQARDGGADDLKKISGVGPKLEKTLNGLGIFHFSQIAAFTPENVTWVDRHLRFKGRIEREKWIEQAKVLAAGSNTEFSQRH